MSSPSPNTSKLPKQFRAAFWAGFWGGNVSSFVKWGTEIPMPPREAGRGIPPLEMLRDLGFKTNEMVYHYSGHLINWGVAGMHHLFSIFFGIVYCMIAEMYPRITLWQGIGFSLLITVGFHGMLLPIFGWAPAMWNVPFDEVASELFGHAVWMWTIEIFRRDIRNRISKAPDVAYP